MAGEQKYWIDGKPFGATNGTGSQKYWIDGKPLDDITDAGSDLQKDLLLSITVIHVPDTKDLTLVIDSVNPRSIRITQTPIEVLSQSTDTNIRVTQALVEVLVKDAGSNYLTLIVDIKALGSKDLTLRVTTELQATKDLTLIVNPVHVDTKDVDLVIAVTSAVFTMDKRMRFGKYFSSGTLRPYRG